MSLLDGQEQGGGPRAGAKPAVLQSRKTEVPPTISETARR
jgi:hypothetical protein